MAAIILWNTKYLEVAYTEQRRQGRTINEDLLRHVAPLGWEHIGLTGDYVWSTPRPDIVFRSMLRANHDAPKGREKERPPLRKEGGRPATGSYQNK